MKVYEFDAVIKKQEHLDGYEYRGSLAKMKYSCHFLGITQNIRKIINKQPGDTVHVTLVKDDTPRVVEMPQDFNEQYEKMLAEL